MRPLWKLTIAFTLASISLGGAFAQENVQHVKGNAGPRSVTKSRDQRRGGHWLTPDDRLSLLAAAVDTHVQREAEPDCSHLVYAIYLAAGFPYDYAPSADLYAGVKNFQRVKAPLPGDLVVWRGHVGMVTKPSQHIFFSYLSSGPGTDDYDAPYWRGRGQPRFYRYTRRKIMESARMITLH